jgi:GTP cyclohydrolase I
MLTYIGEECTREGLKETPLRVKKSYAELYSGYKVNPASVFKVFEDGACNEMVILRDIEFYSMCEHHMLPFFGKAHIAYIPNGKVIGISKLARLLEVFSRRLQIQERLGQQITEALDFYLQPLGSACVLHATHFCMVARGVNKQNARMTTSSLTGSFKSDAATRQEFMSLAHKD